MTQPNISGYTGKPKTGSKKSQPKPHKNPLDKKPVQDKWIKNSKKIENKETEKDIKTIKSIKPRIWESKLQWRQETKKSQRSFSKNKERAKLEMRSTDEKPTKSSYSPKSPYSKPSTGFVKAKGWWNKEKPIKKITRTWEIPGETISPSYKEDSQKILNKKSPKTAPSASKKAKAQFPTPTWEKELKKVDKKELIDPTMV
jgi:hypothetical protein